jgi:hypothetical protein
LFRETVGTSRFISGGASILAGGGAALVTTAGALATIVAGAEAICCASGEANEMIMRKGPRTVSIVGSFSFWLR